MINLEVERGDIVFANLDPVIGSEISKTRPVMIISNDLNNKYSNTVTVIPISTLKSNKIYPFEVLLNSNESGLKYDSIAKANQIRTIDKKRLLSKVTKINDNLITLIEQAICIHLNIEL